jgi:hypothetical protein
MSIINLVKKKSNTIDIYFLALVAHSHQARGQLGIGFPASSATATTAARELPPSLRPQASYDRHQLGAMPWLLVPIVVRT